MAHSYDGSSGRRRGIRRVTGLIRGAVPAEDESPLGSSGSRWSELESVLEEASRFGRRELKDGATVLGWYPAPPGKSPMDVNYRMAWLRHATFPPLVDKEFSRLEQDLGRPIPEPLASFYCTCSNGLNLFSGELSVYGLQRHLKRDVKFMQPFSITAEAGPSDLVDGELFMFGSRNSGEERLYLDETSHEVLACPRDASDVIARWPGFWEMLLSEAERLRPRFDGDGRRLPQADLLDIAE